MQFNQSTSFYHSFIPYQHNRNQGDHLFTSGNYPPIIPQRNDKIHNIQYMPYYQMIPVQTFRRQQKSSNFNQWVQNPSFQQPAEVHYSYLNMLIQQTKNQTKRVDCHWGANIQEKSIIVYLRQILKKQICISKLWEYLMTIYSTIIPCNEISTTQQILMAQEKIQFQLSKQLIYFSQSVTEHIQSYFLCKHDYLERYHFLKDKNLPAAQALKDLLFDISSVYQKSVLLVCENYELQKSIQKISNIIEYRLNYGLVRPRNSDLDELYRMGKLLYSLKTRIIVLDRLQTKFKLLFYLKMTSILAGKKVNTCEQCLSKNNSSISRQMQQISIIASIQKILKTNLFNHSEQQLLSDLIPLFLNDIDCILLDKQNNTNEDLQVYLNQQVLCLQCKQTISKKYKYFYILISIIKMILVLNPHQTEQLILLRFVQNIGNLFGIDCKLLTKFTASLGKSQQKIKSLKDKNYDENQWTLEN